MFAFIRNLRDGIRYKLGGGYVQDVAYRGTWKHYSAVNELRLNFQQQQFSSDKAMVITGSYLVFRHKEDLVMLRMISPGSARLKPISKISSWQRIFEISVGCLLFCLLPFVAASSYVMNHFRKRRRK